MRYSARAIWPGAEFMRRAGRDRAGISPVEMLIGVLIVVLGIALVTPALRPSSVVGSLPASAQEIAGLLRAARSEAVSSGGETRVYVDRETRQLTSSWSGSVVSLPDGVTIAVLSAQQVPVTATIAAFTFFADGSATGGNIRIETDRSRQVISVDWLTGAIVRANQPL